MYFEPSFKRVTSSEMNVKRTIFIAVIAFVVMSASMAMGQARTAQSGEITINVPTHFITVNSATYSYSKSCAAGYISCTSVKKDFTGTRQAPNTTCSGSPSKVTNLNTNNLVNAFVNANDCNFWAGSALIDTAQNSDTCKASGNSSTETIVSCTVNAGPFQGYDGTPGDPVTCWSASNVSVAAPPTITPNGSVAGESAVCNNQNPLKYSFGLTDSTSLNGTRVSGLTATLTDGSGNQIAQWSEGLGNLAVGTGVPGGGVGGNFVYSGNAGANANGTPMSTNETLLTSSGASDSLGHAYNAGCTNEPANMNDILSGNVPACGPVPAGCSASDTFRNNDTNGGDQAGYLAAVPSPPLSTGNYNLNVTATIKTSVAGVANLPVNVCNQVHIDAGQCFHNNQGCNPN